MNWLRRTLHSLNFWASNFLTLTVPLWSQGRPIPERHETRRFIAEAFEGNGLCYAATMEIATSMAEAPLKARRKGDDTEIPSFNPLSKLLDIPNDFQSMPELIIETTAHMIISGNCYWLMELNAMDQPIFMQTLPPDRVRPMISNGQLYYEFQNYGGGQTVVYPAKQILHFKEAPDLSDPMMRGMSPIVPIRRFIAIDNVLARYVQDFFSNNAIPPALLIFKNKMTQPEADRISQQMRQEHSTPGNYHKIGISFGDAKLERLGISVKDLDIKPVLDFVETRILQGFNIPPILVGASAAMGVSGWGNNFQEARASFQCENLAPRQRIMEKILNRGLASKFGPSYEIYFDQAKVLAFESNRKDMREFAVNAWNAGAITRNQFNTFCGLPKIDGAQGDIYKAPVSIRESLTVPPDAVDAETAIKELESGAESVQKNGKANGKASDISLIANQEAIAS